MKISRKKVALGILIFLTLSPIIGPFIRPIQIFVPMARTFDQSADAPPFAEALLPLFGTVTILIGVIALLIYVKSRKRYTALKVFCIFNIVYSCLALLVWFPFFGIRFVRHFPITEMEFYTAFLFMVVPHIIWILLLVWCICTFKKAVMPIETSAEHANP